MIRCESQLGVGTTFKIFLPVCPDPVDKVGQPAGGIASMPKGSEVILLVEDEDTVRRLVRTILEDSG